MASIVHGRPIPAGPTGRRQTANVTENDLRQMKPPQTGADGTIIYDAVKCAEPGEMSRTSGKPRTAEMVRSAMNARIRLVLADNPTAAFVFRDEPDGIWCYRTA